MASTSRHSWVLMFGLFVAMCSRALGDASDSPVEGLRLLRHHGHRGSGRGSMEPRTRRPLSSGFCVSIRSF